ncbi:hypothetical protein KAR91_86750 [Candidatus Pacearchaeota archaeon]|nr:hypothetical protein [Candidatus Pacearchaeota archaeon]
MLKARDLIKKYNFRNVRLKTLDVFIPDIYREFSERLVGKFISLKNIEEVFDKHWNEITMMICEVKETGMFKCLPLNIHEILKTKVMLPIYTVKYTSLSEEQDEFNKVMNKGQHGKGSQRYHKKPVQKPGTPIEGITNLETGPARAADIHVNKNWYTPPKETPGPPAEIELPGGFGLLGLDENILKLSNKDAIQAVKDGFRPRIMRAHPDKGGSATMSEMLYAAKKQCLDYLGVEEEEEMPAGATEE